MATATTDHYTIISADTHAGANHETYREFLDPRFVPDFDAWREKYKNPWKDLRDTSLRVRNWDDERRNADQNADGVVGEVIFPNTVPPFFPSFVLFAPPPKAEDYEHRHAGIQAHNRWMEEFCSHYPERRAGSVRSSSTMSTTRSRMPSGSRSTACAAACCSPTSRRT